MSTTLFPRLTVGPCRVADPPHIDRIIERRTIEGMPCARLASKPSEWRVILPASPAPLSRVYLERAEGPRGECGPPLIQPRTFEEIQLQFLVWSHTAPKEGRGYDKCDFEIEWSNGRAYAGRFDLNRGGTDAGQYFRQSLWYRLRFYGGVAPVPDHMTEEQYLNHVGTSSEFAVMCRRILSTCQL